VPRSDTFLKGLEHQKSERFAKTMDDVKDLYILPHSDGLKCLIGRRNLEVKIIGTAEVLGIRNSTI
jgi:hypothetical protein